MIPCDIYNKCTIIIQYNRRAIQFQACVSRGVNIPIPVSHIHSTILQLSISWKAFSAHMLFPKSQKKNHLVPGWDYGQDGLVYPYQSSWGDRPFCARCGAESYHATDTFSLSAFVLFWIAQQSFQRTLQYLSPFTDWSGVKKLKIPFRSQKNISILFFAERCVLNCLCQRGIGIRYIYWFLDSCVTRVSS